MEFIKKISLKMFEKTKRKSKFVILIYSKVNLKAMFVFLLFLVKIKFCMSMSEYNANNKIVCINSKTEFINFIKDEKKCVEVRKLFLDNFNLFDDDLFDNTKDLNSLFPMLETLSLKIYYIKDKEKNNRTESIVLPKNLKDLYLSGFITNGILSNIGKLSRLTCLSIKYNINSNYRVIGEDNLINNKTVIIPNLQGLKKLKIIDFSENTAIDINNALSKLPSGIKELYLMKCNITCITKDILHNFKKLKILDLSENKLTELKINLIKLPKLIDLRINHNQINHLPDNINKCGLKVLYTSENGFKFFNEILKIYKNLSNYFDDNGYTIFRFKKGMVYDAALLNISEDFGYIDEIINTFKLVMKKTIETMFNEMEDKLPNIFENYSKKNCKKGSKADNKKFSSLSLKRINKYGKFSALSNKHWELIKNNVFNLKRFDTFSELLSSKLSNYKYIDNTCIFTCFFCYYKGKFKLQNLENIPFIKLYSNNLKKLLSLFLNLENSRKNENNLKIKKLYDKEKNIKYNIIRLISIYRDDEVSARYFYLILYIRAFYVCMVSTIFDDYFSNDLILNKFNVSTG